MASPDLQAFSTGAIEPSAIGLICEMRKKSACRLCRSEKMCTFADIMTIRRIEFLHEFETLYREHYSRMYYFSLTIVGEEEAARDVVGDVFSRVWDDYDELDHRNMKSFLMMCVRNRSVDVLRLRRRQGLATASDECLERVAETTVWDEARELTLTAMEQAIATLPELTREILRRHYYKREKYADIAVALNITPRMVKRHIATALQKLREKCGGHNFDLAL